MPETGNEVIQRYIGQAIAAEHTSENQLKSHLRDGDDEEVRQALQELADSARLRGEVLAARLRELGVEPSSRRSAFAAILEQLSGPASASNVAEERLLDSLLTAYTLQAAGSGQYETLASMAHAAGDDATESIALQMQTEQQQACLRIWKFLSSRSKIAFNMLTVSEVDPAVETRTADNSLVS